jgi:hypothetical protein
VVCPPFLSYFNASLTRFQPTKADPAAKFAEGDNYFEQHPANWWAAKTSEEKQKYEKDWKQRKADKIARDAKRKWGKTKSKNLAGGEPEAESNAANASKNDQDQSPESSGDEGDANSGSPKATGASAGAAADEQFDDDDAQAQPLDAFGFQVPRLSAKHNNRIVGPPPVKYDEIEIGNRITKSKKDNPNHRYGQTSANPRKFYHDQNIHQCNAAKNDPEDLDQTLVEKHNLHPKFGLALPDSLNPDEPVNDWKAPLKDTNPVMFIQNPRPGTDRAREVFLTTRSQWMAKADQKFETIVHNMKVRGVLAKSGDLELPPQPVEPEVPEPPQIIDPTLISAVERAEAIRQEDARQAAVAAHHAQFSPPPPPTRVNPPTPQRYDPVRDRTYRTPYAPVPPPPAPRGELDRLAEAAIIHPQLPGPMTYALPPAQYGMQQLLPAPAPAPQYTSMYPPLGGQYQGGPVAPPRPGPPPPTAGGSRHRELRPAPPQNRAPPPPPPPAPRPWGY